MAKQTITKITNKPQFEKRGTRVSCRLQDMSVEQLLQICNSQGCNRKMRLLARSEIKRRDKA